MSIQDYERKKQRITDDISLFLSLAASNLVQLLSDVDTGALIRAICTNDPTPRRRFRSSSAMPREVDENGLILLREVSNIP